MSRECPTPERCEIEGCAQPYGPPAQALAREREPIDLDYQPGRIMRAMMRLTDAGSVAVKRGPAPFAAAQEPPPVSITTSLPDPHKPEPPRLTEPTPAPAPAPAELRIVPCPGGWIVYRGQHPAAVAADPAALGATIAGMVQR